jgi:gamma-glutamyltranspeptidase
MSCFGAPGGTQITMGVLQALLNVMDFGMNMQERVTAARFSSTSNADRRLEPHPPRGRAKLQEPATGLSATRTATPSAGCTASGSPLTGSRAAPTRAATGSHLHSGH